MRSKVPWVSPHADREPGNLPVAAFDPVHERVANRGAGGRELAAMQLTGDQRLGEQGVSQGALAEDPGVAISEAVRPSAPPSEADAPRLLAGEALHDIAGAVPDHGLSLDEREDLREGELAERPLRRRRVVVVEHLSDDVRLRQVPRSIGKRRRPTEDLGQGVMAGDRRLR